jgi:hypothetical protein
MLFPIWERDFFEKIKENEGLRGGAFRYAALATPQFEVYAYLTQRFTQKAVSEWKLISNKEEEYHGRKKMYGRSPGTYLHTGRATKISGNKRTC